MSAPRDADDPILDPVDELSPVDGGPSDEVAQEPGALSRAQLQRLAIRGASWTLLHTVIAIPIAFAVNILLARVLGVVDYGRLAYLSSIMGIAQSVVSMGVGVGLVQFGSKAHAAGRFAEVQGMLSSAQAIRLVTAAPVLTLLVVSVAETGPVLLAVAIVFGVLLPTALGGASYSLNIENKTAEDAKNAMIVNAVTQAGVVVAVVTIGTADSVWIVRLVAGGLATVLVLFYILPAYRRAALTPRFRRFPAGFWKFALPAGAAAAVGAMVASRIEVVVLTWLNRETAAGLFALAYGVAGHLFAPAQALVGPLIPAISGLHEVDRASVAPALTRTLRASATAVGGLVATLLPTFVFLLPVIYGGDYVDAAPVLVVLGLSGGLAVIISPLTAFVMARLRGWRLLLVNVVALSLNVGLMLALIPLLGVWGAVIGNCAAAVAAVTVLVIGEARQLGLPVVAVLRAMLPFAAGAVAAVASWLAVARFGLPDIPAAAVAAVTALVVFVGLLWATRSGLNRGDVGAMTAQLPARVRGVAVALFRVVSAAPDERREHPAAGVSEPAGR